MTFAINYYAIAVCAVTSMVLGTLWYGPIFGKLWIKLSGMTEKHIEEAKKKGMALSYLLALVGSLVMAYVMAKFPTYNVKDGLELGFWLWLGFIATVSLGNVLWEGKSWKLYILNNAYNLLQLLIFGSILATWK